MNYWITEERREIAWRYIFDMINSFVDYPDTGMLKDFENMPLSVSFYLADFKHILQTICDQDSYEV